MFFEREGEVDVREGKRGVDLSNGIENLDAIVSTVGNIDIALLVHGQPARLYELAADARVRLERGSLCFRLDLHGWRLAQQLGGIDDPARGVQRAWAEHRARLVGRRPECL